MIIKDYTEIIKEAAALEEFNVSDLITDELRANYSECMKTMAIIPKEVITYEACMVPVFKNTEEYYIEMDNVVKYMNSVGITDIKEAITNIAEANELTLEDVYLVIESRAYMDSVLEEAIEMSKNGDKSLLEECELACKLINMLEAEGVNVVMTSDNIIESAIEERILSNAEKAVEGTNKFKIKSVRKRAQRQLNLSKSALERFDNKSEDEKKKDVDNHNKAVKAAGMNNKTVQNNSNYRKEIVDTIKLNEKIVKMCDDRLEELEK